MSKKTFEIESIFTGVDRLSRTYGKMGAASAKFRRKVTDDFGGVSRKFEGIATAAKVGAAALTGFGAATGAVLFDAARTGADFEQSITNAAAVMKDVTGRGTEEFKALTEAAKEVGRETEFTASQAAQGLEKLGMAGFTARQSIAALPGVIDLATASSTDFVLATDMATDTLGAFGLMSDDAETVGRNLARVNDVIAQSANSANVTLETMFETVSHGGAVAASAGVSFEEFSAMAGIMGSAGIKGSQAGTAMKNIVLRLTNPIGEAAQLLDRLGVNLDDAAGEMTKPTEALRMLEEGFDRLGITGRRRLAALNEIYGKIAGPGVNSLLLATTDKVKDFIEANKEAVRTNKAADVAAFKRDTVLGSTKTLMSAIESVKIEFAELNRGELKDFIDNTTKWIRENQPMLASGLNTIAGAFKTVASAIGDAAKTWFKFQESLAETTLFETIAKIIESPGAASQKQRDAMAVGMSFNPFAPGIPISKPLTSFDSNPPVFEPVTLEGESGIVGNGRSTTTRETKETNNKITIGLEPGLKATQEGDDNPNIQMAPTGGL